MTAPTTTAPTAPATSPAPRPVLPPLHIGRHVVESPVVLAPMAGITNRAFRRLCRESGTAGLEAGGASGATSLYVAEMVTSRALVERTPESMRLISHDPDERPRSVQLYGVDPATVGPRSGCSSPRTAPTTSTSTSAAPSPRSPARAAARRCRGRRDLFRGIVAAVVREAPPVRRPRHGEDAQGHRRRPPDLPRRRADRRGRGRRRGRAARPHRGAGYYSGHADWTAIAHLKEAVTTSRCWATATSGPPRTRSRWCARPAATGSSWDAAASAGRGCSPTSQRPSRDPTRGSGRGCARSTATLRRHAAYLVDFYDGDEGRALPRHPQAHRLVPQGLPGGVDRAQPARPRRRSPGAGRPASARLDLDAPWPGRRRRGPARPGRVAARRRAARGLAALARARRGASARRSPRPS